MKVVPFTNLPTAPNRLIDLYVDAIYEGGNAGNAGDDPIGKLLPGVGNQGGFRVAGRGDQKRVVVLYTSGEDTDWPDHIDHELGKFTYFGDNKRPGHELHDTRPKGNTLLKRTFDDLHQADGERNNISPFFVFLKHPTDSSARSVQFKGLAVPGYDGTPLTEDLIAVWKSDGQYRYQNYKAIFTILDIPVIPANWLLSLLGEGNTDLVLNSAPKALNRWYQSGSYLPLKTEPARKTRTLDEQTPSGKAHRSLLRIIYDHFRESPFSFESFAAYIFALSDERVRIDEVTRAVVDGGRDAIGSYRLGLQSDPVLVDFALEAKCYRPALYDLPQTTVGVKEVARLISRIRHRQFGVLVTTSGIARQAYQEVRDDDHPIIFISGRDIIEILVSRGCNSDKELTTLLKEQFPVGDGGKA